MEKQIEQKTLTITMDELTAMKGHTFYINVEGDLTILSNTGDLCIKCLKPMSQGEGFFDKDRNGFVSFTCAVGLVFDDE